MALDNIGAAGQIERKVYQRRLPENPNKDYYFIIRDTGNLESLLVEYGFIDNANDASKLQNNLTDYVEGVVKAIADYANIPYIPPTTDIVEVYYTVKRGDTLYSIASQFSTTVQKLKSLRSEEHTSELQSRGHLVCRLLLEKKKTKSKKKKKETERRTWTSIV